MLMSFCLQTKSSEVCIKARSTPASLLFKGLVTDDVVDDGLINGKVVVLGRLSRG